MEEKKIKKNEQKSLSLDNLEKDKIRCLLNGLKKRFKQILIQNQSLPKQTRFPDEYFQFDERINRQLNEEEESKMKQLHLKYSFVYEKNVVGLKKLKEYFVNNVRTPKFEIKSVTYVFWVMYYFIFVLYLRFNIYSKDIGVKTIYHETAHHNIFSNLVEEFMSKKHPRRQ